MKAVFRITLAAALSGLAVTANADLIINDIDMEVRSSTYTVNGSESSAELMAEFNTGALVCDTSLASIDMVGSVQSCGGPNTDLATLFSVGITQSADTLWQFGADWGRGGRIFIGAGGFNLTGDYWWGLDWNNSDVINFRTTGIGSGILSLLGFEGCCGGAMSLRYSADQGKSWTMAAVNAIPEPGTLALLGIGLLGLGCARRRM